MDSQIRLEIEGEIKKQRWDKASYAYAIGSLDHYSSFHMYPECHKKQEIIDRFYKLCETKFWLIAGYTTFRDNTILQGFALRQKALRKIIFC